MIDPNTGVNWITIQRRIVKYKRLPRKLKKMLRKWKWVENEPVYLGNMSHDDNDKFDLSKPFI